MWRCSGWCVICSISLFRVWNVLRRDFISLSEPNGSADLHSRHPLCGICGGTRHTSNNRSGIRRRCLAAVGYGAAPVAWTEITSPAVNWTGIYLGLNGGFTFGASSWTDSVTAVRPGNFGTSGFVFGGTVGANYQVGSLVFGVEADGDWADASGFGTFTASALCAGGRLTTSSSLTPCAAALAMHSIAFLSTAPGRRLWQCRRTSPTIPLPAQSKLAGQLVPESRSVSRNWSAKAEYLFANLADGSCTTNCAIAMRAERPLFPT